jgi:hypothetical protein
MPVLLRIPLAGVWIVTAMSFIPASKPHALAMLYMFIAGVIVAHPRIKL